MIISAIAAMAENRVIGRNGELPWDIPEDFKFFKDKTMGHIIIMGRKTFQSLPEGKPLPGRLHIVITRRGDFAPPEGVKVVRTVDEALAYARENIAKYGDEVFIIGGGEIYKEMLPITNRIYLTEIQDEFDGDAYFPEFNLNEFREVSRLSREEPIPFDFVTYERA